ncbi:hypothetical protein-putative 50S ribosomal protein L28 [Rhodopirellula baltica SH 1]|uniref:Uncharacterized protein n=1 Tax=Rhodopirellula baltica (strain DSM 10527 / NCIMB 13988 / SH1) TaxID=243090 RepID=Q7UGU3_RHOBA|nr:hypothetical protein-putative 50S ribosomal protein L28 [Rhodopirellula baltica SH 1]
MRTRGRSLRGGIDAWNGSLLVRRLLICNQSTKDRVAKSRHTSDRWMESESSFVPRFDATQCRVIGRRRRVFLLSDPIEIESPTTVLGMCSAILR